MVGRLSSQVKIQTAALSAADEMSGFANRAGFANRECVRLLAELQSGIGTRPEEGEGKVQNCVPTLNVKMFWLKEAPASVELRW
jgi:hypothetical protein